MKKLLNYTDDNLFWTTSCSELTDFCGEVFSLSEKHPEILDSIVKDQDAWGIRKKLKRVRDRIYRNEKTLDLPGMELPEPVPCVEKLSVGHPRMKPDLVLLFFCLRGYWGSVTDRQFRNRVKDSLYCLPIWKLSLESIFEMKFCAQINIFEEI